MCYCFSMPQRDMERNGGVKRRNIITDIPVLSGIICIRSPSVYRYFCLYHTSLVLFSAQQNTHLHLYPCRSSCFNLLLEEYFDPDSTGDL